MCLNSDEEILVEQFFNVYINHLKYFPKIERAGDLAIIREISDIMLILTKQSQFSFLKFFYLNSS